MRNYWPTGFIEYALGEYILVMLTTLKDNKTLIWRPILRGSIFLLPRNCYYIFCPFLLLCYNSLPYVKTLLTYFWISEIMHCANVICIYKRSHYVKMSFVTFFSTNLNCRVIFATNPVLFNFAFKEWSL